MKTKITILLFFIFALNLCASVPKKKEDQLRNNITSTVVAPQENDATIINTPTITDNENGGSIDVLGKRAKLNSILGYSIFIFLSVLIIILIDNRNLEKRYKKLATDFQNKDPLL